MQDEIKKEGKPVSIEIEGITASVKTPITTRSFNANNVIGIVEGSDPVLKNECIIYTAHFDHIGRSRSGEINNGADDNASGSMALLEVAEAFMKLKNKPLRTVIFAWVNGEEKGLLGSKYYADHPIIPMNKTLADFNLDMVGRSRMPSDTGTFVGFPLDVTNPGEIIVYTAHESSELTKLLDLSARESGIKVIDKGKDLEFGGSDHESFRAKGVPAMFFHSGIHGDLHNVGDDVERIDFDKMEKVSKMVFLLGYKVANQKARIVVDNPIK
jgi:Zn-dependent M28 family amino/carboxypeptidase